MHTCVIWICPPPPHTHTHTHTHAHTHTDFPQLLCSGSRDNSVCLWDTNTSKSISSMYSTRNIVTGLEWVEGERGVLQSSEDKTLRLWDLTSCSTVQQFRARNDLQVLCMECRPLHTCRSYREGLIKFQSILRFNDEWTVVIKVW